MKAATHRPVPARTLRSRAEQALRTTRDDIAKMPVQDVQKLVHELQVHQIELEMQADELRRAQLEIEASHSRLSLLYDFAPVGYLTLDNHGYIREMNLTAATLLGAARLELLGRRLSQFVAPESQHTLHMHYGKVFGATEKQSCELRMHRRDGAEFIGRLDTVLDNPESEHPSQCLVAIQDVTESRRAEQALALFHTVVSNMIEGVCMIRARDGVLVYANPKFERMFGYEVGELDAKPVSVLIAPESGKSAEELAREITERLKKSGEATYEVRNIKKDGTRFWSRGNVSTLRHPVHGSVWVAVQEDITARKEAEMARARLAAIVESTSDAILSITPEEIITSWNKGAERVYGYTAEEIVGRPHSTIRPPDRTEEFHNVLERIRRGEVVEAFETVRNRKDGRPVDISLTLSAITDEAGRLTGFSHVARDITDRKRAEAGLRELQERLQAILDNSPSMVFLKDAQGRYLLVNRKFAEEFHLKPGQAVGRTDAELFPPKQAALFTANDQKVIETGRPLDFDEVAVHDDGPHASIVTKFPLRDAAGKVYAIGGIVTDITDRKRIEESLHRSERNLAQFFSGAPIGLEWISAAGTILRANQAQLDLLGYTAEEVVGRDFTEFWRDPDAGKDLLKRLAERETINNQRAQLERKDGAIRHVLIDAISVWDGERFIHSSVFTRDITKRVELEREILGISEREQRRIAQDLHDGLGQLLTGTVYLTSGLQKDLKATGTPQAKDAGKILKVLDEAIAQARRLARGLHPVKLEPNGLMAALQELAARTTMLFRVKCRFNCRTPVLIEDSEVATHLYRIAQEAVTNAVKHGRPKRIGIALKDTPERIIIAVKDDGSGLPAAARAGDGMGLRIMQYRASMISASLAIQNGAKGGTSVTASLPKATAKSISPYETQPSPAKESRRPHRGPAATRAPQNPDRG
ncbi:MAG TPA: PAS domain S-box protein [Verrucomicrobiae bacterium]